MPSYHALLTNYSAPPFMFFSSSSQTSHAMLSHIFNPHHFLLLKIVAGLSGTDLHPRPHSIRVSWVPRYKLRDFQGALEHYDLAATLDPHNMVYALNKGAVHLEVKQYEGCIAACGTAVALGKSQLFDAIQTSPQTATGEAEKLFGMIKKAYLRMGRAHMLSGSTQVAEAAIAQATGIGVQVDRLRAAGSLQGWARLYPEWVASIAPTTTSSPTASSARATVAPVHPPGHGSAPKPSTATMATGDNGNVGQPLPTAGALVELSGLSARQYNGARGRVIAATADGTRLILRLVETDKEIRVKPSNTVVIAAACPHGGGTPSGHPGADPSTVTTTSTSPPPPADPIRNVFATGDPIVYLFAHPSCVVNGVDKCATKEGVVVSGSPDSSGRITVRILSDGPCKGKNLEVKPEHLQIRPSHPPQPQSAQSPTTTPVQRSESPTCTGSDDRVASTKSNEEATPAQAQAPNPNCGGSIHPVSTSASGTNGGGTPATVASHPTSHSTLGPGQDVRLHGLKTVRYNGLLGKVVEWVQVSDRYLVRVTEEGAWKGKELLLKLNNMTASAAESNTTVPPTAPLPSSTIDTPHADTTAAATQPPPTWTAPNATAASATVNAPSPPSMQARQPVPARESKVTESKDDAKKDDADESISFEDLLQQFKDEDAMRSGDTQHTHPTPAPSNDTENAPNAAASDAPVAESKSKKKRKKKKAKAAAEIAAAAAAAAAAAGAANVNVDSGAGAGPRAAATTMAPASSDPGSNGVDVGGDGGGGLRSTAKDDAGSRSRAIRARRDDMMQKERDDKLSLQDVADYEIFVQVRSWSSSSSFLS
jgi:ribosomal protein L21E